MKKIRNEVQGLYGTRFYQMVKGKVSLNENEPKAKFEFSDTPICRLLYFKIIKL